MALFACQATVEKLQKHGGSSFHSPARSSLRVLRRQGRPKRIAAIAVASAILDPSRTPGAGKQATGRRTAFPAPNKKPARRIGYVTGICYTMFYTLAGRKGNRKEQTDDPAGRQKWLYICLKGDDGCYEIDPAELHRVFPRANDNGHTEQHLKQTVPPSDSNALQREIELLRGRITDKDAVIDDLRCRLDAEGEERRKLTAILTDQRAKPIITPPPETAAALPARQNGAGGCSAGAGKGGELWASEISTPPRPGFPRIWLKLDAKFYPEL